MTSKQEKQALPSSLQRPEVENIERPDVEDIGKLLTAGGDDKTWEKR